jgi:hypothetical protein
MNNLIAWLKKGWQKKAAFAGAALLAVSLGMIFTLMSCRVRSIAGTNANGNVNAAPGTPAIKTYSDLYAAVIDNHSDARPYSGVSKAAIVYEVPVEGQITRLLAVFARGTDVPEIGPVRSARPYFVDWAAELGPALFLHFGGSPAALARIAASADLRRTDEDGMGNAGASYRRDKSRSMPHNAYTSSLEVEGMFETRGGETSRVSAWLMATEPPVAGRGADASFTVNLSNVVSYNPEWRYTQSDNNYARYLSDQPQKDRDGSAITAKNVIVMKTAMKTIDDIGRLDVTTSGTGKAVIYRNGETIEAVWKNDAAGAPVRFYGPDGAEVVLTDGTVWIEVVKS